MGASKGNQNARKHEIYSRFITPGEALETAGMSDDSLEDEIALARFRLVNALHEARQAEDMQDRLNWDKACRHWLELLIHAKTRRIDRSTPGSTVYATFRDALRAANERQHVR